MTKRYGTRTKKDFLQAYKNFNGTQQQFCDTHGLLKGTFSKWLRNAKDILVTDDGRANVKRKVLHSDEKESLLQWVIEKRKEGFQVDVATLLNYAKTTVPQLFNNHSSSNSEYVLCRRLLIDFQVHLQQQQLQSTSATLISLAIPQEPAIDASKKYIHIEEHQYSNCTKEMVDYQVDYGTCNCSGKQLLIFIFK